jgi:tellurite resistance protein TerC
LPAWAPGKAYIPATVASGSALDWTVFGLLVAGLLALDLVVSSRHNDRSTRAAFVWSGVWIALAVAFGGWIATRLGANAAVTYYTAYLIEKSLSVDNLLLFALVFAQTGLSPPLQRRALLWGVVGALAMRALLIGLGLYFLQKFQWLIYPFAVLLAYAAFRMWRGEQGLQRRIEATCSLCESWIARFIPITPVPHGDRFVVRLNGRAYATPLLVALVAIETADLVFAVDSIPAVFAVTRDPFLVYTSNIFALLGLRALYSAIGSLVSRLRYLRAGIALLLIFVAAKMALHDVVEIAPGLSLAVIALVFGAALLASLVCPGKAAAAVGGSAGRERAGP